MREWVRDCIPRGEFAHGETLYLREYGCGGLQALQVVSHGDIAASDATNGGFRVMQHFFDALGRETNTIVGISYTPGASTSPTSILHSSFSILHFYDSLVTFCDPADDDVVRTESRYAIQDGEAILIGRTWTRCRRENRGGYPAVVVETSRAADAQSVPFGASSANSYDATWDADSPLVPLVLKGRTCESLDENGILTQVTVEPTVVDLALATRKSKDGRPFDTYTVDLFDHNHGNLLREQTKLAADDTVIEEETHVYDEKNRLRSTTWLDGTSMTNAYSCCRLLWSRDREGRKTLRSAQTGEDHLYYAEEDVWIADISTNGAHRVRQHFFDALGRETNTVVCIGHVPGEAAVPSQSSQLSQVSQSTTAFPCGGSDLAIRTDERGCVRYTQNSHRQSYDYTYEYVFADEEARRNWNYDMGIDTYFYRSGPTETCTYWSDGWKRDYILPHYDPFGRRVTVSTTESHDCGLVTNSVTIADWLGRTVSARNPLGVTTTSYDGLTERVVTTTATFGEGSVVRDRLHLYDACGESIGHVQDGITNSTVVAYERLDSDWYRVTTDAVVGPGTNSVSIVKERLTGLGDEFVSESITVTPDGVETVERKWQSDIWASVLTENSLGVWRDDEFCCGIGCDSCAEGESWAYMTDAFGRSVGTMHWSDWERNVFDMSQSVYSPAGDVVERQTLTTDGSLTESSVYDTLGRLVAVTNAEGGVIEYGYDCFGRRISETGATYPVRYAYDSEGRRISLKTTRDGGLTWDETRWTYDPATGLCLAKTYADGSVVSYTHTPDGLPLRTTEASGAWKECVYDSSRRLVGVISSDGAQDAFFEHDAFGRIVLESNTVSQVSYSLDQLGLATNEVQTVDGVSVVLRRTSDEFGRQVLFARVGGIASSFAYTNGTHLAAVSTSDATASYRFSSDWLDEDYELMVGGRQFDRWTSHDWYRRGLVDGVWYAQGDYDDCIIYSYDSMGRPSVRNNDVFGYNARGEVVSATIGGQSETHAYNDIGTHVASTDPSANTAYGSNARNQYALIVRTADAAQEGESVSVFYDTDGSLTTFGPWTYAYDSGRRLTSVASNGVTVATMAYDAQGRRVKKVSVDGTHRYYYDGWLLVYEHVTHADSTVDEIEYVWGKDISGRRNGAAGIGGLLYLKRNGAIYVPYADVYGNILGYWDANGNLVASYTYNAFGRTIAQQGAMADTFALQYSTKYFDVESGLLYYGYRCYNPSLGSWLSTDPLGEYGGINLYSFCKNSAICLFDIVGGASSTVIVEGLGVGWVGATVTLNGKTAVQLNGELYYLTTTWQEGMRLPEGGSSSSLFLYRADKPKKGLRLDYHELPPHSSNPSQWHINIDGGSGVAKVANSSTLNHTTSAKIKGTGKVVTVFKHGGRICFIAGVGMSFVDIYKAENHVREVVKEVGGWSGAYLGGRIGASLGLRAGMTTAIALGQAGPQITTPEELVTVPVFGFIAGVGGGIVGGVSGAVFGTKVTEKAYEWAFAPLEKEEWEVGCVD